MSQHSNQHHDFLRSIDRELERDEQQRVMHVVSQKAVANKLGQWGLIAATGVAALLTIGVVATGVGAVAIGVGIATVSLGTIIYKAAKKQYKTPRKEDGISHAIDRAENLGLVFGAGVAVAAIFSPPVVVAAAIIGATIAGATLIAKVANTFRRWQKTPEAKPRPLGSSSPSSSMESPHLSSEASLASQLGMSRKAVESMHDHEAAAVELDNAKDTAEQLEMQRQNKPFRPEFDKAPIEGVDNSNQSEFDER